MIGKILDKLGISKYLAIVLGVMILTMVVGGYFYFDYTQEKMAKMNRDLSTLRADNLQLKTKIEGQVKAIENALALQEKNREKYDELSKELKSISEQSRELSKLYREHDLNKLANAKPKLIEKRINDATQNLFDELESITDY